MIQEEVVQDFIETYIDKNKFSSDRLEIIKKAVRYGYNQSNMEKSNEWLSRYLYKIIPEEEKQRIFNNSYADVEIGADFMGFVKTYYHLSQIIPKDMYVYDFGCGYNSQSYFFTEHQAYIAVNPHVDQVFKPKNCAFYNCTTNEFLSAHKIDREKCFAICNYVPNWYNEDSKELIKQHFQNVYTFYPSVNDNIDLKLL